MCGVVGIVAVHPVNQLLYNALLLMQHRGQDAAGIATAQGKRIHLSRGTGLVRDVFRTRDMRNIAGNMGIGHVRYPTAGSAVSAEEAQPFYVNAPFGIVLGHNGNLTNAAELEEDMYRRDRRHINTESDSEVLLNVFAHELQQAVSGLTLDPRRSLCSRHCPTAPCQGCICLCGDDSRIRRDRISRPLWHSTAGLGRPAGGHWQGAHPCLGVRGP